MKMDILDTECRSYILEDCSAREQAQERLGKKMQKEIQLFIPPVYSYETMMLYKGKIRILDGSQGLGLWNEESKKMKKTMLKQQFAEFLCDEEERPTQGLLTFSEDSEIIVIWSRKMLLAGPLILLSLELLSSGSKPTISDQQRIVPSVSSQFEKKAGRKMNYNNQQPARFDRRKVRCYKCLQLGHFARECNVKTRLMIRLGIPAFKQKRTTVEVEKFAMMGISPKAQKEKKEWEVKFEATLARFEKWKESSKNLKNLIDSSMSTRTKVGLGFQEYFGVDEVFDLSTPSVFYSDPVEKEVKPLYSTFVKAGEMHVVPPSITGTYMPSPIQSDQ
ncbi:ribonuclease H-like domain-containing protein [Tanacetum coccineum]